MIAAIVALFAVAHWIECRNKPNLAAGYPAAQSLSRV
jgi:hypothetical protein